jgi:PHD/YefM family antitoxin component YafN of YafNO toxin-antitoxin module
MDETVQLPKKEYEDMIDYMERMRETIEVLSNKATVKKVKEALDRIESGEFYTKEEMVF